MRLLTCCGLLLALAAQPALAQRKNELEIPDPEPLTLTTRDMVQIHARFYPGGFMQTNDGVKEKDGKTVVPVILLHGWQGKQEDFDFLASYLQRLGHAVIVPDLRGHGRSTVVLTAAGEETLDPDRFRAGHFNAMVSDVVACKKHLMDLHNQGELNIELLSVVGADMGALVALNWMAYDWTRPLLPTIKQGQDVKLFVLLSPPRSFKGMSSTRALQVLRDPRIKGHLQGMIIVGLRDTKGRADAKALYNTVEESRGDTPERFFFVELDTSLGGAQLINARPLNMGNAKRIGMFVYDRLVRKAEDYPWRDRSGPLSD